MCNIYLVSMYLCIFPPGYELWMGLIKMIENMLSNGAHIHMYAPGTITVEEASMLRQLCHVSHLDSVPIL